MFCGIKDTNNTLADFPFFPIIHQSYVKSSTIKSLSIRVLKSLPSFYSGELVSVFEMMETILFKGKGVLPDKIACVLSMMMERHRRGVILLT